MNVWMWIAVGIAVYWAIVFGLGRLGLLPKSVRTTGPITTIRTTRGREFLDRLARFRRFWRAVANIGIGIALVVMVGSFLMVLLSALIAVLDPSPGAVHEPQNVLVIPGVNQFLPLEVAPEIIIGLVVGLVVHEGGHGLLCRVEGIEIKSMGVALLAFIPLGAFVEPNEASTERASRGAKTRMFAAGVTSNFAITILVFALLFGPIAGSFAVAPGAAIGGVLPGSAADSAGISAGDRITGLNGEDIEDFDDLHRYLDRTDERSVTAELNDGASTIRVDRSLLVVAVTPLGPIELSEGATITAVDGETVSTMPEFRSIIEDREVVALAHREASNPVRIDTIPIGSLAIVRSGPLAEAGVEEDLEVVITEIDGQRVTSSEDLGSILRERAPGTVADVSYYHEGERQTVTIELGEADHGGGLIGVTTIPGMTGMTLSDFGIQEYPASGYLALLGGGDPDDDPIGIADSFLGKTIAAIFLPLSSIIWGGVLPFNFPGFTSGNVNFFVVNGPLSAIGGWAFLFANVLFWTGWINLNLGFFNCIPAIPLDGGHILRSATESLTSRLPIAISDRIVGAFVTFVALIMLVSFVLLIFGAGLLSP